MKTIEERADEYIGHSLEVNESPSIYSKRIGFLDGAKSEHEELTQWHAPNVEKPTGYVLVMLLLIYVIMKYG